MRTLPDAVLRDVLKPNPEHVYLTPLKIDHSELTEPLYLVNNTVDIASSAIDAGKTHLAFPYRFTLPSESKEQPLSTAKIEFVNVDKRIVNIARASTEQPDVTFCVVSTADLDVALVGPVVVKMFGIQWNDESIKATLRVKDVMQKIAPNKTWTPFVAGGLFQR